ncbi:MAG: hypothetical protein D6685_07935 [Bacteroidetes bacterium]|nr:MAG: hypothetical protein D6685_07935 [Bacteroidota bacterium]
MSLSLYIPRRFAPSYSLLGRWLRRRTGDPRRAEALFIVAVTGLLLAGVLGSMLGWVWLYPTLQADPSGATALRYAGAHLAVALAGFFLAGWGFRPAIHLTAADGRLRVRRGPHTVTIHAADLIAVATVDPLRYHRHERRYAGTTDFVNHPERDVLLLRTARGHVLALGLTAPDRAALIDWLATTPAPASNTCAVGVE